MGSSRLRVFDPHLERKDSEALPGRQLPLPTFDVPYFKYIDEEDEDDEWSSRSQSSTEDDSVDSLLSDRYMVVSGTPEKILEHLLNDLHLAEVQHKETGKLEWGRGLGVCACVGSALPKATAAGACQCPQGRDSHCLGNWDGWKSICFVWLSPCLCCLFQSSKWTHVVLELLPGKGLWKEN